MTSRTVEHILTGTPTTDGAGVRLLRFFGKNWHTRLDPFLMFDVFFNDNPDDYLAGFPHHPHRGFETLTYMIEGKMRHSDSAGNQGLLETGGAQWMCAGKGIIHSELPEQTEGRMRGMQLWINLPSHTKMQPPAYVDMQPTEIPEIILANGIDKLRLIVGSYAEQQSVVVRPDTNWQYWDVHLSAEQSFSAALHSEATVLVYVYQGSIQLNGQVIHEHQLAVCANNGTHLEYTAQTHSKCLVISGLPVNEPIVQYGPFVMNTVEEIQQAVADFQQGRL